jgi:hypothetical protein
MVEPDILKDIKNSEVSETVRDYLRTWIVQRKKALWRSFCNSKPKLEDFLKIQAMALSIEQLQQELLLSKLKGEEARKEIEELEEESALYDK